MRAKKAQGSTEFVIISGFMLLIFMGMFVTIQYRLIDAQRLKIYDATDQLSNLISSEVSLANSATGDYYRQFSLPEEIKGFNYSITLQNSQEVSVLIDGSDHVIFLDYNVTGTLKKGVNLIRKTNSTIILN